jgi:PPOX class probable F420-dependent enzyme
VTTLTASQIAFVRDHPFVGVLTDLRADGSPHSTVVWVDADAEGVSFNTAHGRLKPRNIARDARVSLTVVNPENAYQWVSVTGRGVLVDEGADAQIDRLAKKYLGEDTYPWRSPDERRVSVRIVPEKVEAHGLDG